MRSASAFLQNHQRCSFGVEEGDILEAGRLLHGLERMSQMKFAILERDGAISIIPKDPRAPAGK
jgi:uncharacterized membrane protein YcaP (DUF421 family)